MASTQKRLQAAYITGRQAAANQIRDALLAISKAMEDHDVAAAAALKYGAEFANNVMVQDAEYYEDEES